MARTLTTPQRDLLRSADLQMNALLTFYLDEGTYRFCDESTGFDLTDGTNTWIGASVLGDAAEVRSSQDLQAEQTTLVLDGMRMTQYGVDDPAKVMRDILTYLYQQRRVDYHLGFRYSYSSTLNLIIPVFAGKINSARLVDKEIGGPEEGGGTTYSQLEIVLDSLAMRYSRATHRTRSHEDQLDIDPTDRFYSFTVNIAVNEKSIFWGKAAPLGVSSNAGGSNAGYSNAYQFNMPNF
jgi:hypothetical protein